MVLPILCPGLLPYIFFCTSKFRYAWNIRVCGRAIGYCCKLQCALCINHCNRSHYNYSSGIYLVYVYKSFYGKISQSTIRSYSDLSFGEQLPLWMFAFLVLFMGLLPKLWLDPMHKSIDNLVNQALTSKLN